MTLVISSYTLFFPLLPKKICCILKTFSYLWHSFCLSPGIAICTCFCNIYSFSEALICDQLLISTAWGSLLKVCWTVIMSYFGSKTISASPFSSGWVSISLHAQSSCFIRFFSVSKPFFSDVNTGSHIDYMFTWACLALPVWDFPGLSCKLSWMVWCTALVGLILIRRPHIYSD